MADNPTTFQNSDFSSNVFQKLYEQKQARKFCDISLFVNNKVIKAHRNVLACSSPYFDSILKNHKIIREHITVSCFDSRTFNAILNFMYTGEITVHHSIVEELLKLANQFLLTKVVEYCIEFLETKLTIRNCLFTYFITKQFKLKQLGEIVEDWIANHIDEVSKGEEIMGLDKYQIIDFLKNKNFILSTNNALNLVSHWVLRDCDTREKDFDDLIRCCPANELEPLEVFQHLDTSALYNKSELCLYRILDYLIMNNWMLSNFKTRYDVLQVKYGQILHDKCMNDVRQEAQMDIVRTDSEITQKKESILIKAKLRQKKQTILKKLMLLGLKPDVRMAALKMLTFKRKSVLFTDDVEEVEVEEPEEKIGVKCPICLTMIHDSLLLEQHLALSHAKNVTYKCGLCAFICQYHADYLNHMKTHFSGPPYKCDFCDFGVDQVSKLISHRSQHLDELVYSCTVCSFKCRLKQNLICHMKIHTTDMFKCEHCSKTFRFGQTHEAHLLTHSSEKDLSCDSCGFHTKFISHMIAHKRIHLAELYRCSYPHCKYTTSKKTQLANHSKNHNGVRPHTCAVCGRGFMEKSHLVRHERIHLEEKPFKCSHCDYASSRRDKLKEHYTRHHGENASAKVPYKARPLRTTGCSTKSKSQTNSDGPPTTSVASSNNFTPTNTTPVTPSTEGVSSGIQELVISHQSHSSATATNLTILNSSYHHFGSTDLPDFHHAHAGSVPNIHTQILGSANNATSNGHRSGGNNNPQLASNNTVNHHMLTASVRSNPTTATSTAAAVAAAMMLDPRFHHNSTVPYHPPTTAVSMTMAAVQSSQSQSSNQQSEYSTTIQNCMPLF